MKSILKIFAIMALGISFLSACGKENPPTDDSDTQNSLLDYLYATGRTVRDITIKSTAKGKTMKYSVWMPKDYDANKKYPFLYLLHGYGDDNNSWLDKGNAGYYATQYIGMGGEDMIIVMPDGLTDFYIGAFEQYMYEELMPNVESLYPFNGKRAIAGLSMGGYGTLYHALAHPEMFEYAYSMSPAVFNDMAAMIDKVEDKSVFPTFTIEVGEQDYTVNNSTSKNLADDMIEKGLNCEYISRSGSHDWKFWQECLPKALKKAGESFVK